MKGEYRTITILTYNIHFKSFRSARKTFDVAIKFISFSRINPRVIFEVILASKNPELITFFYYDHITVIE